MRWALLISLAMAAPASAQPCDPFSREEAIAIPRALQLKTTCGNGKIDDYAVSCTQRTSGGCGHAMQTSIDCIKGPEICDGSALGGQTCASQGYAGGRLRCAASCTAFATEDCFLCPPGTSCKERRVAYDDFEDLVLVAQGETVRVLWSDPKELHVAEVGPKGELVHAKVIAPADFGRPVAVPVGTSAMELTGSQDKPVLSIVKATGEIVHQPLAAPQGAQMFMPILSADHGLGVIVLGDLYASPRVMVIDELGKEKPIPAQLYASNARRAVVIQALAAGKHHVKWATFEDDITSERGDSLFLMWDAPHVTLAVLHQGIARWPFQGEAQLAKGMTRGAFELPDVTVDGKLVATFNYAEHVAFGVHHSVVPAKPTALFGNHGFDGAIAVARTSTIEVQAAKVGTGNADSGKDPDHPPDQTFVLVVHKR